MIETGTEDKFLVSKQNISSFKQSYPIQIIKVIYFIFILRLEFLFWIYSMADNWYNYLFPFGTSFVHNAIFLLFFFFLRQAVIGFIPVFYVSFIIYRLIVVSIIIYILRVNYIYLHLCLYEFSTCMWVPMEARKDFGLFGYRIPGAYEPPNADDRS